MIFDTSEVSPRRLLYQIWEYLIGQLHIVDPVEMEFLPLRLEALVDTTLDLPLAMKGRISSKRIDTDIKQASLQMGYTLANDSNNLIPFNDCRHLNFLLNYTDQKIFEAVSYTNYSIEWLQII